NRADKHHTQTENADVSKPVEAHRLSEQKMRAPGADQCFTTIANIPANDHRGWNVVLELRSQVRWQSSEQENPPNPWRSEQQRCNQNRIRRPENGNRMRPKRKREAELGAQIVAEKDPQRGK